MRIIHRSALATLLLGTALLGCSDRPSGEHVIRAGQPIQGGTIDQTDTAVVGILINTPQGMALCSGSLIAPNLVLSAHHCVADSGSTACSSNSFGTTYAATSFMVTTSYNAAANIFNKGGAFPSPDGTTWFGVSSVSVPGNNICGQDMSALVLSSPITGVCPIIPRVDVDVTDGEAYTAIGFGITSPTGKTAGTRYDVSGMAVICGKDCGDPSQSATQEWLGGASTAKGTCEGDSGGPAIDASGRVIGTVSRGPATACNQTVYESVYGEATWIKSMGSQAAQKGGYAAAGWVTGGSTSSPANGYCGSSGTTSSGTTSSSSGTTSSGTTSSGTTSTGSGGGSGCPAPLTCIDGSGMGDYGCFDSSTTSGFPSNATSCSTHTPCPTGYSCWATSATATTGKCIEDCTPGSTGTSGSTGSSSGTSGSTGSSSGTSTATSSGTSGSTGSAAGSTGSTSGATTGNTGATTGTTTGSSGSAGTGGAGAGSSTASGTGGTHGSPGASSGCSVSAEGSSPSAASWLAMAALGLVLGRRGTRSRARR